MFERFTQKARRIVVLAQEEARALKHNYIGTEHILLGLLREGDGVAGQVLTSLEIDLDVVRQHVLTVVGEGSAIPSGHIPFTPRGKKVLELALREALQLGHNYIGTEHILLALIREGESTAAQVLGIMGLELTRVRQKAIEVLASGIAGSQSMAVEQLNIEINQLKRKLASIAEPAAARSITYAELSEIYDECVQARAVLLRHYGTSKKGWKDLKAFLKAGPGSS